MNQIVTNDCMFECIHQRNLSWTIHRAEREIGEGATEHAPASQIITGKCVLGGGFYCPSQRAGGAMVKRGRGKGGREREMNVTLALICHIVNHRYEENASRLNVQLRHK